MITMNGKRYWTRKEIELASKLHNTPRWMLWRRYRLKKELKKL